MPDNEVQFFFTTDSEGNPAGWEAFFPGGHVRGKPGPSHPDRRPGAEIKHLAKVIEIALVKMSGANNGAFACPENERSLEAAREIQTQEALRTRRRVDQGKEGKNEPHVSSDETGVDETLSTSTPSDDGEFA